MVPPRLRLVFGFAIAVLIVGAPLWYRHHVRREFRSFRVVEEGVLYRSAQLPLTGLKRLINDYRLKTVVCLRQGDRPVDQAEEAYCRTNGIRFVRIPPRNWGPVNGIVPAEEGLHRFRQVMDDPSNYPVLIHCLAGTHRTGAYVAVYRMEYQGWQNAKAVQELRTRGYVTLDTDQDVHEFLRDYRPRTRETVRARPVSQEK